MVPLHITVSRSVLKTGKGRTTISWKWSQNDYDNVIAAGCLKSEAVESEQLIPDGNWKNVDYRNAERIGKDTTFRYNRKPEPVTRFLIVRKTSQPTPILRKMAIAGKSNWFKVKTKNYLDILFEYLAHHQINMESVAASSKINEPGKAELRFKNIDL